MNERNNEIIETLRSQIKEVITLLLNSNDKVKELQQKNNKLELELFNERERIKELEKKVKTLNLAGGFKAESENSDEAKQRVNKIVREIDKCIALLNK